MMMKMKRFLGFLLSLALVLGLMPWLVLTVKAADHNHSDMIEWSNDSDMPSSSGNYYLTVDVTLSSPWSVPNGTTTICLNGHGIVSNGSTGRLITVESGRTLNLVDCGMTNVTHKYSIDSSNYNLATVNDALTDNYLTFNGGYIAGGSSSTVGGGISSIGTLNLDNITIIGNRSKNHGGGIFINRGTVNISKCRFYNNISTGGSNYGGALAMANGKYTNDFNITVTDSVFTGNYSAYGGAIQGTTQNAGSTNKKVTLINDTFTNNTAQGGGAVNINAGWVFTVEDCTFNGNVARNNTGGAIRNNGGVLTVNGTTKMSGNNAATSGAAIYTTGILNLEGNSEITANNAKSNGGGIYFNSGTFNISGKHNISGNYQQNSTVNNVYLPSGKYITVTDMLDNGTSIGVTMNDPGVFINSTNTELYDESNFTSDNMSYHVVRDNTSNLLKLVSDISYTVTFKVANGKWDDDGTEDKTVILTGYEGDTLKLAANQIPSAGTKPNDAYKEGSWDVMPSSDTEITEATTYTYTYAAKEPATVTEVPTVNTLAYNGLEQVLVSAGVAEGGTMKYALTSENKEPAADAYTFDNLSIPTATEAGTYYVWYKAAGDEDHLDSEPACISVNIQKAKFTPSVSINNWTVGEAAGTPVLEGNIGNGKVTYFYAVKGSEDFTENVPEGPGQYILKAMIEETDNYKEAEAVCSFDILEAYHQHTFDSDPRWLWRFIDGKAYAEATYRCGCGETKTVAANVVKGVDNDDTVTYTATDKNGKTNTQVFIKTFTVKYNNENTEYEYGATCRLTAEEASDWTVKTQEDDSGVVRAEGTKTFYFPVTESVTVEAKKSKAAQQSARIEVSSCEGGKNQFTYKVFWSLPEGAQVKSTMIYRSKDNGFELDTADKLLEVTTLRSYNMKLNVRNGEFNYTAVNLTSGTRQTVMAQVVYRLNGEEYTIRTDLKSIEIK